MPATCDYHPNQTAYWDCPSCDACLCPKCVDRRVTENYGKKTARYFCPKCNVELDRLAFEETVVPFWNRLHAFFLYPLRLQPLLFMAGLAVVTTLFSGMAGLFAIGIHFLMWGMLLKYAHAVLMHTAQGRINTPPEITMDTVSSQFEMVFKQIFIYVAVGLAAVLVFRFFGGVIGLLFLGLAILAIPSMIIMLVATGSFISGINPMVFVPMAWRIGWTYLIMYLFLILLGAAPAFLAAYVLAYLPPAAHLFLVSLSQSYYVLVSYHLMGYVLYQYHEEIGYDVDLEEAETDDKDLEEPSDPEARLLDRVSMLTKDGNLDDAIALVKSSSLGAISHPELAETYYNLLKTRQRFPEMIKHGESYMDLLYKAGEKARLCDVFADLSGLNGFMPRETTLFRAASSYNETGKPAEAIQVYNRFIKANGRSPLVPKAYFLASVILHEKLKKTQKARGILETLIRKYPEHEIIQQVRGYLNRLGS